MGVLLALDWSLESLCWLQKRETVSYPHHVYTASETIMTNLCSRSTESTWPLDYLAERYCTLRMYAHMMRTVHCLMWSPWLGLWYCGWAEKVDLGYHQVSQEESHYQCCGRVPWYVHTWTHVCTCTCTKPFLIHELHYLHSTMLYVVVVFIITGLWCPYNK